MSWHEPRALLLRSLLLDWLGQILILIVIFFSPGLTGFTSDNSYLHLQLPWLVFLFFLYPLLGWLFGSYTVLRWRRLSLLLLLQRLLITGSAFLILVSTTRWLINPAEAVWLLSLRVQLVWIALLMLWSLVVRIGLRRGLFLPDVPRMILLAQPYELEAVLSAWRRVPNRHFLLPVELSAFAQQFESADEPILIAITESVRRDPSFHQLLSSLEMRDPRQLRVLSLLSLFETQQERLPPVLLTDSPFVSNDLPWAAPFSVQVQLKRMADLLVAGLLLVLTSPFVFLSALLIWVEDRGPVLYAQQRSGWLGRTFTIYKLRTMYVQPSDAPARWTEPGDQRITSVGFWLRRFRLDELPQLFNVLNGEMSLIGPRPERPELEEELEQSIPHYRKRHWMRPGLSGWAQVCAPYASSIEDSDLKLSYDLYYLRHFSIWLDLVILFRTVKIVLKAGGR